MKIIGDRIIPFEDIYRVSNIEGIKKTKPNSLLFFGFDEELLKYSHTQNLKFAIYISSIKEGLYANSLGANYIVCSKSLAKTMQKIADNYMFDSKILAVINSSEELEEVALAEIDGAIYDESLKGRN